MFLFSKQHEELVGIYASHLARHRCIDLFVHMMELRLNSRYLMVINVVSTLAPLSFWFVGVMSWYNGKSWPSSHKFASLSLENSNLMQKY